MVPRDTFIKFAVTGHVRKKTLMQTTSKCSHAEIFTNYTSGSPKNCKAKNILNEEEVH